MRYQDEFAISKEEIKASIFGLYLQKLSLEHTEDCFWAAVYGEGISSSDYKARIERSAAYAGARLVAFGLAANLAEAVEMLKKEHQDWLDERSIDVGLI